MVGDSNKCLDVVNCIISNVFIIVVNVVCVLFVE